MCEKRRYRRVSPFSPQLGLQQASYCLSVGSRTRRSELLVNIASVMTILSGGIAFASPFKVAPDGSGNLETTRGGNKHSLGKSTRLRH